MVASAPTYKPHGTHSSIPENIEIFQKLEVKEGYLIHTYLMKLITKAIL
jgi:hypothetical protein